MSPADWYRLRLISIFIYMKDNGPPLNYSPKAYLELLYEECERVTK